VCVGLLGFAGDGAGQVGVDASSLQRSLEQALPLHVPANVELQDESRVQVQLSYTVKHVSSEQTQRVEQLVKRHMRLLGTSSAGVAVYDVAPQDFEAELDTLYAQQFPVVASPHGDPAAEAAGTPPPAALLLMNLDKTRMNPTPSGTAPYVYRYRYARGGATQQWIARQRYIVADLSAGPVAYGSLEFGKETVSHSALPTVEVDEAAMAAAAAASSSDDDDTPSARPSAAAVSVKFLAELSSFVLSAMQHVFVGDIHWRNMHYAEKIVVPVVVFRNHRRFHPLRQGGGASTLAGGEGGGGGAAGPAAAGPVIDVQIDLGEIETQLRKLLLPEQELLLVSGAHHLHDHHQLSTAVFKALKQDSVYAATQGGSAAQRTNNAQRCSGSTLRFPTLLMHTLICLCCARPARFSLQPRPYLDSKILTGPVAMRGSRATTRYTCAAPAHNIVCVLYPVFAFVFVCRGARARLRRSDHGFVAIGRGGLLGHPVARPRGPSCRTSHPACLRAQLARTARGTAARQTTSARHVSFRKNNAQSPAASELLSLLFLSYEFSPSCCFGFILCVCI
jgi:hypothetical protein